MHDSDDGNSDDDANNEVSDTDDENDVDKDASPLKLWAKKGKDKGNDTVWVQHKMACILI